MSTAAVPDGSRPRGPVARAPVPTPPPAVPVAVPAAQPDGDVSLVSLSPAALTTVSAPVAAGHPTDPAARRTLRSPVAPRSVVAWQRLAGNAAVSAALGARAGRPSGPVQVQRGGPTDVHQQIRDAVAHNDYTALPSDADMGAATDDERVTASDLCISAGYVAPQEATARVYTLWSGMGDRLTTVSMSHEKQWQSATKFSPRLMVLEVVTKAQNDFKAALRGLADSNIDSNRQFVDDRVTALGLDGKQPLDATQEADLRHAIQANAYHAYELRQEQAKMRKIVVGYESQDLGFGVHESHFDPGRPPKYAATLFSTPKAKWEQVKETWDDAEGQLSALGNDYPELYAAGAGDDDGEALLNLSRVSPEHFGEQVKQQLLALSTRIVEVKGMIASGKLELLDLGLLTKAVLAGVPGAGGSGAGGSGAGGRDWSKGFDHWVANRLLADREADKAAVKTLLQTIEVTALVVGTFAGGIGPLLAAGVTVGIEAFQAGQAAVDADRQKKAATATPLTGTALVSKAQADAKKSEAIAHMVAAVVTALMIGGAALSKGLQALRLKGLVQDEALLAKLQSAVGNDSLLETLLRKTGDPIALDTLLAKAPAGSLGPLLDKCANPVQLGRLLDRVNPQQLDQLLAGVAEQDLPRLEKLLATVGDGEPASITFNIGGEMESKAGQVIINPGRQAMSVDRLRTMRPDNIVVEARAESIPFPTGSGKAVFGNKLPNSIDWASAAKEFKRVLAPGGKVEITVFGPGEPLRKALASEGFVVQPPVPIPGGGAIDRHIVAFRP